MGSGHTLGERGGEQAHTLNINELPQHTHAQLATTAAASTGVPSNARLLAKSQGANFYAAASNPVAMDASALGPLGGSQAHLNMQPFLTLNFCIALQGIFPSQT
jgi:microcystin-dependent protein